MRRFQAQYDNDSRRSLASRRRRDAATPNGSAEGTIHAGDRHKIISNLLYMNVIKTAIEGVVILEQRVFTA